METGLLIALGFAVAVIVLAVVLSRIFDHDRKRRRHDINASNADGRASATWIGIRTAQGEVTDGNDHSH